MTKNELANKLLHQCKFDESLKVCDEIFKKENNAALLSQAKNIASCCYFLKGDLINGFKYYDDRPKAAIRKKILTKYLKEWEGQRDSKCNLLIPCEEGLGDELMYISFLHLVVPLVNKIYMECDKRLIPLLKITYPDIDFFEKDNNDLLAEIIQKCNNFVLASELLNMFFFRLRKNEIPPLKYKSESTWWHKKPDCLRVGISYYTPAPTSVFRMPPKEFWTDIISHFPDVFFVNLQDNDQTPTERQSFLYKIKNLYRLDGKTYRKGIRKSVDIYNDITLLADFIDKIDLTITISNSIAHIAGALQTPTILVTQKFLRYHWTLGGNPNMFYPNMNVIRGGSIDNWDDVKEKVIIEIQKLLDKR